MEVLLFLILCLPETVSPTITPQVITPQQFYGNFKKLMEKFLNTGENVINMVFSEDLRYCAKDLMSTIEAIQRKDQWTMQMIDSFGKFGESFIWPGTESLCLSVVPENTVGNTTIQLFKPHYCLFRLIGLSIGVCLPTTCTEHLVNGLFTTYHEFIGEFQLVQLQCISDTTFMNDSYAMYCRFLCFILFVIMILGTAFDIILRLQIRAKSDSPEELSAIIENSYCGSVENITLLSETEDIADATVQISNLRNIEGVIHHQFKTTMKKEILEMQLEKEVEKLGWLGHLLFSFSTVRNLKNLFNVQANEDQIQCLNGLRVLAILTIVYGHVWFLSNLLVDNMVSLPYIFETKSLSLIINGAPSAVDTFFLMSGLLLTYKHLKQIEHKRSISWFKFYLDRLLRLSPSYWFTVFVIYLGFYVRNIFGPLDGFLKSYAMKNCEDNWWRTILYVSNSISFFKECYGVEWYIATDMQFYWLSPILLYLIVNYNWLAVGLASITVLASSVTTGALAQKYDIIWSTPKDSLTGIHYLKGLNSFADEIYIKPYCRITPYLFGMMVGWLLFKNKRRIVLNKLHVMLLWCLAFTCFIGVTMIPYYFQLSTTTTSIYFAFMYIVWSITASIVIILCATGNGGIVNSFLSWSGWLPFSRLSYGVYLLHLIVIFYYNGINQRLLHLTIPHYDMNFMSVIISCFAFSTLLYLTIESPFMNLMKVKTKKMKHNISETEGRLKHK